MTLSHSLSLLAVLVFGLPRFVSGADSITHSYDFEPAENPATEPGWVHVDPTIRATETEPGIVAPEAEKITSVERGETPLSPPEVVRDYLGGGAARMTSDDEPALVFRDVVPSNATKAALTIFRTDAGDIYQANFRTRVILPDGSVYDVDAGSDAFAKEHEPIAAEIPLAAGTQFLDVGFLPAPGAAGNSVRVNGLTITYTVSSGSAAVSGRR